MATTETMRVTAMTPVLGRLFSVKMLDGARAKLDLVLMVACHVCGQHTEPQASSHAGHA